MFDGEGEALKRERHGGDVCYGVLASQKGTFQKLRGRHELVYIPLLELRSGRILSLAAADSGVDVSCLYSVGFSKSYDI